MMKGLADLPAPLIFTFYTFLYAIAYAPPSVTLFVFHTINVLFLYYFHINFILFIYPLYAVSPLSQPHALPSCAFYASYIYPFYKTSSSSAY